VVRDSWPTEEAYDTDLMTRRGSASQFIFAIGVEAVENKEWKFENIFLGLGEFRYVVLFEC
jgi:hypothetical protein